MTPIERAEQLKAARRAELARQAEELARRDAERQAQSERNLREAIATFLVKHKAEWMAEFMTRVEPTDYGNPPHQRAYFDVPGHRTLFALFSTDGCFDNGPRWLVAHHRDGYQWFTPSGDVWEGFPSLADALLGTEIGSAEEEARKAARADEEPIPF